ncbi:MAG: tyrosine recombinase XerC [Clostridia bacterium]|nr:tyrosine recombinase XerC [Clostridia bacterium]
MFTVYPLNRLKILYNRGVKYKKEVRALSVLTLKSDEFKTFPLVLREYAAYNVTIKGNSEKTICEYLLDLRTFFRFMLMRREGQDLSREDFERKSIVMITEDDVRLVNQKMIIEYLMFAGFERDNSATTRMRKLSSLRSFYHYAYTKHIVEVNPTADIDAPKKSKTLPKYLTVEEAVHLLETVRGDTSSKTVVRDYAIIVLFLNTGMRLSELVGLNLQSFDSELTQVKVLGKGNKERLVYLNRAATAAIEDYLRIRLDPKYIRTDTTAFFLSGREQRISVKTVQWIVYKYLKMAGLGDKKLSVHKLRHTAATLMYQSGKVDIRVLKDILGHEQLNTTQIYTHIVDRNIEDAVSSNPLADVVIKKK